MPLKKPNLGSPSSIKNIHNRKLASLNVLYYSKDTIGTVRTYKGTADGRLKEVVDLTSKADKVDAIINFDLIYTALGTRGTSVIDFGLGNMTTELAVTGITQALTTSNVTAHVRMEATPEHPVDDLLIDPIRVMVKDLVDGVGFTIYGAMDNAPANGTYKIDWSLTN